MAISPRGVVRALCTLHVVIHTGMLLHTVHSDNIGLGSGGCLEDGQLQVSRVHRNYSAKHAIYRLAMHYGRYITRCQLMGLDFYSSSASFSPTATIIPHENTKIVPRFHRCFFRRYTRSVKLKTATNERHMD